VIVYCSRTKYPATFPSINIGQARYFASMHTTTERERERERDKVVPVHETKAHRENSTIALLMFNLGARWK
jgi:hypothetical protein